LEAEEVTRLIRAETTGNAASIVAKHPKVRVNLLQRQRDFALMPGLIADGRDMGTVVFPKAPLKLFLTASAKVRADRGHKQVLGSGIYVNIEQILSEVEARDERDSYRTESPLVPADDALIIDTSALRVNDVLEKAWEAVLNTFPELVSIGI